MKKWYLSKTLWANALALVGAVILGVSGKDFLTPELQVSVLAGINVVLRLMTKSELIG
jgi:hypothetical protein